MILYLGLKSDFRLNRVYIPCPGECPCHRAGLGIRQDCPELARASCLLPRPWSLGDSISSWTAPCPHPQFPDQLSPWLPLFTKRRSMQPAYKPKETAGARRCNLLTCGDEVQCDVSVGCADRAGEKEGGCRWSRNEHHIHREKPFPKRTSYIGDIAVVARFFLTRFGGERGPKAQNYCSEFRGWQNFHTSHIACCRFQKILCKTK